MHTCMGLGLQLITAVDSDRSTRCVTRVKWPGVASIWSFCPHWGPLRAPRTSSVGRETQVNRLLSSVVLYMHPLVQSKSFKKMLTVLFNLQQVLLKQLLGICRIHIMLVSLKSCLIFIFNVFAFRHCRLVTAQQLLGKTSGSQRNKSVQQRLRQQRTRFAEQKQTRNDVHRNKRLVQVGFISHPPSPLITFFDPIQIRS